MMPSNHLDEYDKPQPHRLTAQEDRRKNYIAIARRFVAEYALLVLLIYLSTLLTAGAWPTMNKVLWAPLIIAGVDALIISQRREKKTIKELTRRCRHLAPPDYSHLDDPTVATRYDGKRDTDHVYAMLKLFYAYVLGVMLMVFLGMALPSLMQTWLGPILMFLGPIPLAVTIVLRSLRSRRNHQRLFLLARRADRLNDGTCPWCEYDLTDLTEPRCPECGEPLPEIPAKSRHSAP